MRSIRFAGLTCFPIGLMASAPSPPPTLILDRPSFQEEEAIDRLAFDKTKESPPISVTLPQTSAGVTLNIPLSGNSFPELTVKGISESDKYICVRISSIDSYYHATAVSVIPEAAKSLGYVNFIFRSKDARVRKLSSRELAASATVAQNEAACWKNNVVLETNWTKSSLISPNFVTFLIASGGSGGSPEIRAAESDIATQCASIPDRSGLGNKEFRYACTLNLKLCRRVQNILIDFVIGYRRTSAIKETLHRYCGSNNG